MQAAPRERMEKARKRVVRWARCEGVGTGAKVGGVEGPEEEGNEEGVEARGLLEPHQFAVGNPGGREHGEDAGCWRCVGREWVWLFRAVGDGLRAIDWGVSELKPLRSLMSSDEEAIVDNGLVWLFTGGFGSCRCRVLTLTLARVPIERTRKDRRGENRRLYNLRERFSRRRYTVLIS